MSNNPLSQAVTLIKSGQKQGAAKMLVQIVKNEPVNENAWLWLAYVVEKDKRVYCLQKALEINPLNNKTRAALEKLQTPSFTAPESAPKPVQPVQPPAYDEETEPQSPFEQVEEEYEDEQWQYPAESQTPREDYDSPQGLDSNGYYIPQGMDFRDSAVQQPSEPQPANPTPAEPQVKKSFERIELKANWSVMLAAWVFFVVFPGSYSFRRSITDPGLFLMIILIAMVFSTIAVLLIYRLPHVKIILEDRELIGPGSGLGLKVSIPYDDINIDKIKKKLGYGNYVIPSFDGDKIEVIGFNTEQFDLLLKLINERQSDSYSYYR